MFMFAPFVMTVENSLAVAMHIKEVDKWWLLNAFIGHPVSQALCMCVSVCVCVCVCVCVLIR